MNGTLNETHDGDGNTLPPLSETPLFDVPPNSNAEYAIRGQVIQAAISRLYDRRPHGQNMWGFLESLEKDAVVGAIIREKPDVWKNIKAYSNNPDGLSHYFSDFLLQRKDLDPFSHQFMLLFRIIVDLVSRDTPAALERHIQDLAQAIVSRERRNR